MLATRLPWRLELLHVPLAGLLDTQTVVDRQSEAMVQETALVGHGLIYLSSLLVRGRLKYEETPRPPRAGQKP
jgi:hypothetical protein